MVGTQQWYGREVTGHEHPSPVQQRIVPALLQGSSVFLQGCRPCTGKTAPGPTSLPSPPFRVLSLPGCECWFVASKNAQKCFFGRCFAKKHEQKTSSEKRQERKLFLESPGPLGPGGGCLEPPPPAPPHPVLFIFILAIFVFFLVAQNG